MKLIAIAAVALALAGCASTRPASVAGECAVFRNPGHAVQGKTSRDQQDIDGKWLEPGISSCGWARPASVN